MTRARAMFPIAFLISVGSCKTTDSSKLSASNLFQARLGEGYDIYSDSYINGSCLTLPEPTIIPTKNAAASVEYNMSADEVEKIVGGRASLKINLDSVDVSGEVSFANEFRKRELTTSLTFYQKYSGGLVRLNEGRSDFYLNKRGIDALAQKKLQAFCGTHFVTGYEYYGSIIGSLFVSFSSMQDKMAFDAKVAVDIAGSIGAAAQVKYFLEQAKSSSTIRLRVVQAGGDPLKITRSLSENVAACSIQDQQTCVKAFSELVAYAQSFSKQFVDANGREIPSNFIMGEVDIKPYSVAYMTSTQADGTISKNPVAKANDEGDYAEIIALRRLNQDLLAIVESDFSSIDSIVRRGIFQSDRQKELISAAHQNILELIKKLRDESGRCYGPIIFLKDCQNANSSIQKMVDGKSYDLSAIVETSVTMAQQCAKLVNWYEVTQSGQPQIAALIMDEYELEDFLSILHRPEFGVKINPRLAAKSETEITPRELDCAKISRTSLLISTLQLDRKSFRTLYLLPVFTRLSSLNLANNPIVGLGFTKTLVYLKELDVSYTKLLDISELKSPTLRKLKIAGNRLSDLQLPVFAQVPNLTHLDLANNERLLGLSDLPGLSRLEEINVTGTGITSEELKRFVDRINKGEFLNLVTIIASAPQCTGVSSETSRVVCRQ
jgi:hypothetical protein